MSPQHLGSYAVLASHLGSGAIWDWMVNCHYHTFCSGDVVDNTVHVSSLYKW